MNEAWQEILRMKTSSSWPIRRANSTAWSTSAKRDLGHCGPSPIAHFLT